MDFEQVVSDISALNLNLYDLAIYRDGGIQTHCFSPCNRCNDGYSVAKAFILTAIGLLWEEKKLRLTDAFFDLFPEKFPDGFDPKWRQVTLYHALTHRVGFDQRTMDIDYDDATTYPTDDYLANLFSMPLLNAPGEKRVYTDAAYYLLARAVGLAAGERADEFLHRRILKPLGFREAAWSRDPLGYPIGATGLYTSAEDNVKLGALYLNGGEYEGQRLLSKEWVDLALAGEFEFRQLGANGLIGKGGMFGQGLCLSREKRFACAWHAHVKGGVKPLIEYIDSL